MRPETWCAPLCASQWMWLWWCLKILITYQQRQFGECRTLIDNANKAIMNHNAVRDAEAMQGCQVKEETAQLPISKEIMNHNAGYETTNDKLSNSWVDRVSLKWINDPSPANLEMKVCQPCGYCLLVWSWLRYHNYKTPCNPHMKQFRRIPRWRWFKGGVPKVVRYPENLCNLMLSLMKLLTIFMRLVELSCTCAESRQL